MSQGLSSAVGAARPNAPPLSGGAGLLACTVQGGHIGGAQAHLDLHELPFRSEDRRLIVPAIDALGAVLIMKRVERWMAGVGHAGSRKAPSDAYGTARFAVTNTAVSHADHFDPGVGEASDHFAGGG